MIAPRVRLTAGFLAAAFLLISGCAQKKQAEEAAAPEDIIIGLSMGTLREERWLKDRDLFIERAQELGAAVNVEFAGNDAAVQLSQADNLILQGVDVLVVVPHDGEAAAAIVEKAHAAGIKVIAYDRMISNADLDFYISFDSKLVGKLQAEAVVKVAPRGKFAYIGGSPSDNNAYLLKEGSMEVLAPLIERGDVTLVMEEFCADWRSEIAHNHIKKYLDGGGRLDAVIAANDGTAFGAIQALMEHGLAGKIPISGQDADLSACQRIVQGTQTVTVYKPLRMLAYRAAEMAVAVARGEPPVTNAVVPNGRKDVASFLIEPIAVTQENMEEVIVKDGFHPRDLVFQAPAAGGSTE